MTALAEEIEYLRSQLLGVRAPVSGVREAQIHAFQGPDFVADPAENPHWISEEEEDLRALRDGQHIDEVEYRQALDQLRAAVGPIQIES